MPSNRTSQIARMGAIGIAANVALSVTKFAIGSMTGSIAVSSDAANNLADAMSSIVTLVGTRIASRGPDREHPLGHGRIEYVAALAIAVAVILSGVTMVGESVEAIASPSPQSWSPVALALVLLGIAVKVWLSVSFISVGRRLSSPALIDSGVDARLDVIASSSTLVAYLLMVTIGVDMTAWAALAISGLVCWSGVTMAREAISELTGRRVPVEIGQRVISSIEKVPGVLGAYDLVMHSYGPDMYVASAHVEVDASLSATEIDVIGRTAAAMVMEDTGVILAALGTYAMETDRASSEMREKASKAALAIDGVIQVHGFAIMPADGQAGDLGLDGGTVMLDVVAASDADDDAVADSVRQAVSKACDARDVHVIVDHDISGIR